MCRRVLIISSLDFSRNGASQKRQRLLMRALENAGNKVTVVNPQRTWGHDDAFTTKVFPPALKVFPWRIATLLWFVPTVLWQTRRTDIALCFDRHLLAIMSAVSAQRMWRIPLLHDMVEHPDVVVGPGLRGRIGLSYMYSRFLPRLTGVIAISSALERLFRSCNTSGSVIRIPSIAEIPAQIAPAMSAPDGVTRFLYAGSMSEAKDGVLSLIRAFALARDRNAGMRLTVLGYGSPEQKLAARQLVSDLGLEDLMDIKGEVPQADMPAIMAAADVLVMCRPQSLQAEYGFPTKLAEYLAIGRAVITTDTSDIGSYLKDRISAYVVKPGDIPAFADAMSEAAADIPGRMRIARAGREIALEHFDEQTAGRRLAAWIETLVPSSRHMPTEGCGR